MLLSDQRYVRRVAKPIPEEGDQKVGRIAKCFIGITAVAILVGGATVPQASAAPCNVAVVVESLACTANGGTLSYTGTGDVRITAMPNAAFFDSFLVLYKASNLSAGAELGGLPLLFNHGAPVGPITIDPAALGFLAGDELVFALYVDTDPDGHFDAGNPNGADGVIGDAEYRVFMGSAARNTPNAIQDHVQGTAASPPFDIAFLVGFEDRLLNDPLRDNDFNDHIFKFEGALRSDIPNPAALWLLGMGLIGLAIGGRYRTRR